MMTQTRIELTYPITVDGVQTTELLLRRPKVRDMLTVEKQIHNDAEKEIMLFANLCELSPDQLMELDMADYAQLQTTYQHFLSSARTTPAVPSSR